MRTTLDIDDDILQAAKELARAEKKTAGQVLSELRSRATAQSRARGGSAAPCSSLNRWRRAMNIHSFAGALTHCNLSIK